MVNITKDKRICGGSPCLNGTRFTVFNLLNLLTSHDVNIVSVIDEYNLDIDMQDVKTILEYCANKKCLEDDIKVCCEQCTLDERPDDDVLDEPPVDGWELARSVIQHHFPA